MAVVISTFHSYFGGLFGNNCGMNSVWQKYLVPLNLAQENVKRHDTIVVGGGIAGVMCAFKLFESGHHVTLVEAGKILNGVTANTTAHVTALQAKYSDIPTKRKRRLYFESQINAIDEIERLVKEYEIDCEFKRLDSYVFADDKNKKTLLKEYKLLKKLGAGVEYLQNQKMPFGTFDAIRLPNQAQFNPILFCQGLVDYMLEPSDGSGGRLTIIENTRIKKVRLLCNTLKAENQTFKYKRVVFATGFPVINIRGLYAFKMYKSFSYAVCASGDKKLDDAMYESMADDGLTYRNCSDGVIVGGLDHRTGRWKCDTYFNILKKEGKKFGKVTHMWSANDCMTFDSIPFAGRMFRFFTRNRYMISGFGKWGMANSVACAGIVDDIINKRKNKYKRLFKPTRILNVRVWPVAIWNFLIDGLGLLQGLFSTKKRRCPHMGCRLKYNPNTKTYDCPCHGSRLTHDGEIIVSPTVKINRSVVKNKK